MELMEDDDVKIVNIVLPDISDDQKDDNYRELVDKASENDINVMYIRCGDSLNAKDIEMRCLNPGKR